MDLTASKLLSFINLLLLLVIICSFHWGAARSHTTVARKNLTCYFCHTLTHGDICQQSYYNVQTVTTDLPVRQCSREDKHCIVRRHSYTLNNSDVKVWMMERDCSKSCINECVISLITGDKMKLHLCTSCCQSSLCNLGNAASANMIVGGLLMVIASVTITLAVVASSCTSGASSSVRRQSWSALPSRRRRRRRPNPLLQGDN